MSSRVLALVLGLQLLHQVLASLDKLRKYQRECYGDLHPCIMFLNENEAFGCAQCGENVRQAAVIEFTQKEKFVRFIEQPSRDDPRVVMVPEHLFFETEALNALDSASGIAAILVYEGTLDPTPLPFPPLMNDQISTDETDPNWRYNFYNTRSENFNQDNPPVQRNSIGLNIKHHMYPFNMFRVNRSVAEKIRKRSELFPENVIPLGATEGVVNRTNPTSPRFKIQSIGRMYACPKGDITPSPSEDKEGESQSPTTGDASDEVTSLQCLEDKTCLPIGGQSVWSALDWINPDHKGTEEELEVLAISAPMDSISFFPTLALGARAEITSLAVLMAVAEAVGKYRRENGDKEMIRRPVYFAWNAQSWGYAGSSRFLKDVKNFECKIEKDAKKLEAGCEAPYMESLKFRDFNQSKFTLLNIGQLSPQIKVDPGDDTPEPKFFFQRYEKSKDDEESVIESALKSQFMKTENITFEDGMRNNTPVDASQSFQRYFPETKMVTLTSYKNEFSNLLYHSMYDVGSEIKDKQHVYRVARITTQAVIQAAFDDPEAKVEVDEKVIDQVLTCMQSSWDECDLAREYLRDAYDDVSADKVIPGNYPGSFFPAPRLKDTNPSGYAKVLLIHHFLAYHNSYEQGGECMTVKDCEDFEREVNERDNPQTQSHLHKFFCTRGKCVASVAHKHNAYGPRLEPQDDKQTQFSYKNESETSPLEGFPELLVPLEAAWTESVWDDDLGLCGLVEDTPLFGGLILGGGIALLIVCGILTFFFDRYMFKSISATGTEIAPVWSAANSSV